ncbi:UvrB/UvrC motif-containing protein [bacterium]|nr:UvrB/UvrC motif-containing protein [bacterium]
MICESCQKNTATVHLTEIVQKQKKELHLCEDCARDKGDSIVKGTFSVNEYLGNLADAAKKKAEKGGEKTRAKPAVEIGPCPACGLTFPDFKASGRLGCYNDYEHFKRELLPLLEKIHGATQHTGRVPSQVGTKMEKQKLLAILRKDLNQAIQREEYERAAELRDKIKNVEGP